MSEPLRDQSAESSVDNARKEGLTFVDPKAGKAISLPILKNTYQSIISNNALDGLDMGSIVRGIYEKIPRKSTPIRSSVGDCLIEKSISATAYCALFNCTQNEIDNLAGLPGMIEEIDQIVIESIPQSIRPSTEKQRKFADEIRRILKIDLDEATRGSKEKLSKFISEHIGYYKLVKDVISELGDKYWIRCQDCYLSQTTLEIFTKLISNTDINADYAEQFERLVDLRGGSQY